MAPTSRQAVRSNIHQTPRQPGESLEAYSDRRNEELAANLTQRLRANPSFDVGPGFHVVQGADGPTAVPTEPSFLMRHPWLIPLMGAGAGIGLGAMAGTGLLAAAPAAAPLAGAPAAATTTAATAGVLGEAGTEIGLGTAAAATGGTAAAATVPAAAGTVGTILSYADRARQIGQVVNGINTGRQQGREAEANATNGQDRNAIDRYRAETGAAQLNLQAPQTRANTAVRGDILANAQPFRWTGETRMVGNTPVPQHTGGISPDLFSPQTRELGRTMTQQALTQQQTNGGNAQGPAPPLTALPQTSGWDTALGILGQASSLYGAYSSRNPQTTYGDVYPYARR